MATLSDEDHRALIEQVHLLQELTNHPGWPVLVDWTNERMKPRKLKILNGGAKDFEDYLKDTHYCAGATDVLDAPKIVATMLENEQGRRVEQSRRGT